MIRIEEAPEETFKSSKICKNIHQQNIKFPTENPLLKEKNDSLIKGIKRELNALKLPQELIDRMELFAVMDIYASKDKTGAAAEGDKEEDFQDLGRSARLKAIEEGYLHRDDGSAEEGSVGGGGMLEVFENDWFSFLVE